MLFTLKLLGHLTNSEINAALKPLITKIHPDLFGLHPDIQEVNSRSLSNLHGWISKLNENKREEIQLPITFYLKKKEKLPKSVSLLLSSNDVVEGIKDCLMGTGLSTTHIEYLISSEYTRGIQQAKVEYDEDMFSFGGKINIPELDMKPPLRKWLRHYLDSAVKLQNKHERKTQLVRKRMDDIKDLLKLKEFLWCSANGLNLQTGVIGGFHRMVLRHKDALAHLEGTKVIFSDLYHTTLAADRSAKHTICLAVLDQHEDWANFLRRYNETDLQYLIKETDYKEYEIARILGGIQILRPMLIGAVGGSQIARPVEILLYKERISVLLHHLYMLDRTLDNDYNMSDLHLEIDIAQWETGTLFPSEREKAVEFSVTERGTFLVRYDIKPDVLLTKLRESTLEALERRQLNIQLKRRRKYLVEKLTDVYGFKEIRKQPGLPDSKMVDSLQRLLRSKILDDYPIVIGSRILISKDYRKHFDGFMVIPWDWKF